MQGMLFELPAKKEKQKDPRVRDFIRWWFGTFWKAKGIKYQWTKKDSGSVKRVLKYFDDNIEVTIKDAAIAYLNTHTTFAHARGWAFCDFANKPQAWAIKGRTEMPPGEKEWHAVLKYVREKGRYSQDPLPLSEVGKAALRKIGGFSELCNSTPWSIEHKLKKDFLQAYIVL